MDPVNFVTSKFPDVAVCVVTEGAVEDAEENQGYWEYPERKLRDLSAEAAEARSKGDWPAGLEMNV